MSRPQTTSHGLLCLHNGLQRLWKRCVQFHVSRPATQLLMLCPGPYGAPPGYGGYHAPTSGPPPTLGAQPSSLYSASANANPVAGPPPGTSSAPGMGPPPGAQQMSTAQASRPSGLPPNFLPPSSLPNINFNAPVIRMGTSAPTTTSRVDALPTSSGLRPGLGADRGSEHGRGSARDNMQSLTPPSSEDKLRTIFIHQIPDGFGGDEGIRMLLESIGGLRRWDGSASVMDAHRGSRFGFAVFEDPESLSVAVKLLHDDGLEVPLERQLGTDKSSGEDFMKGIEKVKLQVEVDESSLRYIESYKASADIKSIESRLESARSATRQVIKGLCYPTVGTGADADKKDAAAGNDESGENVEVVNIPVPQDDELADIPAEMREVVTQEIAAFRERSNKRDMQQLKQEEEIEEMERRRHEATRSRLDASPTGGGANNVPLGPRGSIINAPSGPRGQQNGANRKMNFVNGGTSSADHSNRQDPDTDASDEELNRRQMAKQKAEDDKLYAEAERKWLNRERSRQAALERERQRERHEEEAMERRVQEQLDRDKAWNDEREASRRLHPYYRDHAGWARKRNLDRVDEEARDEADRRAEQEERRREQSLAERARGMADSFLDEQAGEMAQREKAAPSPQPFKLSLGAAAQRAHASRVSQRRTIADVEGLLDDEEAESSTRRQLIPIQFDSSTAQGAMTEEEIAQAVQNLAQEIPSRKEELWSWEVKWDFMDESVVTDKLRPFVEKKIVEYLGVQEEMLVETVEEHLRSHGTAAALAEELEGVRSLFFLFSSCYLGSSVMLVFSSLLSFSLSSYPLQFGFSWIRQR